MFLKKTWSQKNSAPNPNWIRKKYHNCLFSCYFNHERISSWHHYYKSNFGKKRCRIKRRFFYLAWNETESQSQWRTIKSLPLTKEMLWRSQYCYWNAFFFPSWSSIRWIPTERHSKQKTLQRCHNWWSRFDVDWWKSKPNFTCKPVCRVLWTYSSNENNLADNCV